MKVNRKFLSVLMIVSVLLSVSVIAEDVESRIDRIQIKSENLEDNFQKLIEQIHDEIDKSISEDRRNTKQEILKLRVRQVDLFSRKITLNPGTTKNREGRVAPVTDELFGLLAECIAGKGPDDYVLTREGKRVRDFRKAWNSLFKKAGVERRIPHDMRRTGAMNLDRSGISRTVAKQIGGWKTDTIYERYRIVSEADLYLAAV